MTSSIRAMPMPSSALGAVEPAAHHHDRLPRIAEAVVEAENLGVAVAHHQLQFADAARLQPTLSRTHQPLADPGMPAFTGNREVIDPAAVAVMPDHDAADDRLAVERQQDFPVTGMAK